MADSNISRSSGLKNAKPGGSVSATGIQWLTPQQALRTISSKENLLRHGC